MDIWVFSHQSGKTKLHYRNGGKWPSLEQQNWHMLGQRENVSKGMPSNPKDQEWGLADSASKSWPSTLCVNLETRSVDLWDIAVQLVLPEQVLRPAAKEADEMQWSMEIDDYHQAEHKPCILEKLQSRAFCWTLAQKKGVSNSGFWKASTNGVATRRHRHVFHMWRGFTGFFWNA